MSGELKVYPLMLHESTMKDLQTIAVKENKKVEDIIEGMTSVEISREAVNGLVNTNIYHNIERPLSQALQPETNLLTIHKLVTDAREQLRKYLRQNGYKGQF